MPPALRSWFTSGLRRHRDLVRSAHEAGVVVLAGTDLPPGSPTTEIRWLAEAGLTAHDALGAGSWAARRWLGYPGIEHGAPADLVVFDEDPRSDLRMLDHPRYVVARGAVVG